MNVPTSYKRIRALMLTGSVVALLSSGCATIAHGRHQRIQVETSPPAAQVSVNGARRSKASLRFETPGEVVLHRKEKNIVLRIEKDGYQPAEVVLERKGSAWTPIGAMSFLSLGLVSGLVEGGAGIGLGVGAVYLGTSVGVDLATGSAYRLDPSKVSVTLQPESASEDEGAAPADTTSSGPAGLVPDGTDR